MAHILSAMPEMYLHCRRVILLALAFALSVPDYASARRAIPDDNLAYPVLLTLKSSNGDSFGSGSGFYLNTGEAVYLVTAKHVLAPGLPDPNTQKISRPDMSVELLSYSPDAQNPARIVLALNFSLLRQNGNVRAHPSQDVAVIKIGTIQSSPNEPANTSQTTSAPTPSGRVVYLPGVTASPERVDAGILTASLSTIRTFDQVLVGNDAILYGYPVSLALGNPPKFDPLRPLLRKGLIAGEDIRQHSIIIDGPVYRGNSGGPVFEIEPDGFNFHYYLIGVVTEFVPQIEGAEDFAFQFNSGYSIAKPMDFVLELINKAP